MFFKVKSTSPDSDLAIYRARRQARLKLTLYHFGPTEMLISRHLQENYGRSLKAACIQILQNARFHINFKQEIIVTIPDPELNQIAKLITYGNGSIIGSRILKDILTIS